MHTDMSGKQLVEATAKEGTLFYTMVNWEWSWQQH